MMHKKIKKLWAEKEIFWNDFSNDHIRDMELLSIARAIVSVAEEIGTDNLYDDDKIAVEWARNEITWPWR